MSPRRAVSSGGAAAPLAHYSPAIVSGRTVYCSGSLGTDLRSGEIVPGGIEAQTRQALMNLDAILTEAGSGLAAVLKMTCYLARTEDFPGFDRAYRELVPSPPPARATVRADLMVDGALLEIEAIATVAEGQ